MQYAQTPNLIWFIDSVFVETCGAVPPVKWQRAISRVGKAGREIATRSERMKANERKSVPGRTARVDMVTVGGDGET